MTNTKQDVIEDHYFFQTPIYKTQKTNFLNDVNLVSDRSITSINPDKHLNEIYPVLMTGDISQEPEISEFSSYVVNTSWNILVSQGYAMHLYDLGISSMWMQEHHKYSGMEQHVHGDYSQLVAFYFLKVPKDGSQLLIHDPRAGKVQIDLQQSNHTDITHSSKFVAIIPEEGDLIITNAYLPHSFSRNASDEPMKFIHVNIFAVPTRQQACSVDGPEII